MLVGNAFDEVGRMFVQVGVVVEEPEVETVTSLLGQALSTFVTVALPMAIALMVVGVAASAAQGGVHVSGKPMKPTLKKLNPFPGMKRMFGGHGLWEATKAVIKTAALGTVVVVTSD